MSKPGREPERYYTQLSKSDMEAQMLPDPNYTPVLNRSTKAEHGMVSAPPGCEEVWLRGYKVSVVQDE